MRTLEDRFWGKVAKGDGCWLWTGKRDAAGYGRIGIGSGSNRRSFQAHRVVWFLSTGQWPLPWPAEHVCHRCDNPPCVRPDHLFVGTARDNMQDREAKGRGASHAGTLNGRALLDAAAVRDIRANLHASRASLAARHGVTVHTITAVRRRLIWRHV